MVKLHPRLILQGISSVNFDKRDLGEVEKQYHRVTHLHLQKKKITALTRLDKFVNLTVLYLYENQIQDIKELEGSVNIEILYLQRNKLQNVRGLAECRKLKKLYLGSNEIDCLDGLGSLVELEELHVENQRLKPRDSLQIDPITLQTCANSLRVLDISGNHISTLENFAGMQLVTLVAKDNRIADLNITTIVISTLQNLRSLDLRNNPITKQPKYRERIIGNSAGLDALDDKEVTNCSRRFMQSFCRMKANRLKRTVESFEQLPAQEMPRSSTAGGEPMPNAFSAEEKQLQREAEMFAGPYKLRTKLSDIHFPNRVSTQNRHSAPKGMRQIKSTSLDMLLPPEFPPPQGITNPQFILAPSVFFKTAESQMMTSGHKPKNINGKPLHGPTKTTTTILPPRKLSGFLPTSIQSRIIEISEETDPNSTTKAAMHYGPEPSMTGFDFPTKTKNAKEQLPSSELVEAEAHYAQMIEAGFPASEFAKLILGISPGGDGGLEGVQEKSISWPVSSPVSGSISQVQTRPLPQVERRQRSFSLAGYPEGIVSHQRTSAPLQQNKSTRPGFKDWELSLSSKPLIIETEMPFRDQEEVSFLQHKGQKARKSKPHSYIPSVPTNPYNLQHQVEDDNSRRVNTAHISKRAFSQDFEFDTQDRKQQTGKWQSRSTPTMAKTGAEDCIVVNSINSNSGLVPIPVFQKQVYKLPPWPHIQKLATALPRTTYLS